MTEDSHTIEEVAKLLVEEPDNESFETEVQKEDSLNFCKSSTWVKVVVLVIILLLAVIGKIIFFVNVSVIDPNYDGQAFIMNDEHLKWCDHLHSNGLGNRLASYWLYRSLAFWFNLVFENDAQCSCKTNTHFCSNTPTKIIWTQYLPTEFTMTLNYLLHNENNTIYESISLQTDEYEKWINFASLIKDDWSNIDYAKIGTVQEHPILISVINTLFLKIVRYEMQQAFNSYYLQRHRNDIINKEYNVVQRYLQNQMNGIIVHWRCGDILSGHTYHYGFNGLSYYSDALTLFDLNKDSNISVSVMVNLDKKSSRGKDFKYFDECSKLLSLINDKFRNVFRNVTKSSMNYTVISDGTINSDMYLLSNAKYIICGFSSFCDMAGIGNKNNIIFRDAGRQHIWVNKANKKYFPKYIHMLRIKNRIIHPRDVNSNLTQIAQYIVSH